MKKNKISKKKKIIIAVISILLCILIGIFSAIPALVMSDMVNSHMDVEVYSSNEYGLKSESINLTTEDGLSIAAWEVNTEKPKAIVILLSGIQNPSVTAFWGYSKMLKDNNYASLLIEMRAHGDSDGDKVCLGMDEYLDVKAGVKYIKGNKNYKDVPIVVWGTSMGGSTAINSIGEIPEIDGLISCSAYSSWQDAFCDNMVNMGIPSFMVTIEKPFVSIYMGFTYGFNKLDINPLEEIQKLNGRPALLAHSTEDSQVPYASFERLIVKAKEQDNIQIFEREGDEHFICYTEYFENPIEDTEFSLAILKFLNENFN
ncbi:alpha/beta hydrolase [Abyssisolibacter fermentans]|uniref:alpha/beta hydrolase n=1 Tax=Abyssisolibacter fermentans TaxID=1766203 RepID=UPI0008308D16|nr:alpha/beta hydrolase [Abyssisolibacter fermentans]